MRRAFAETLLELANCDERIVVVTADLGYGVFDSFKEQFGNRFINVGISEAQLINFAAGLALEGFIPFSYSIASFLTARAYEQIRFCIAYHSLPVILVGAGGGYLYANSGPTHHAPDDLSLMKAIPGLDIYTPGTPSEVRELLKQIVERGTPSYIRIGKYGEAEVDSVTPITIGKARMLSNGKRSAICTIGDLLPTIYAEYEAKYSNNLERPAFFHFNTLRPLDRDTLSYLVSNFEEIHVFEECFSSGGLYAELVRYVTDGIYRPKIIRHAIPDIFVLGNPNRFQLWKKFNLAFETL